MLGTDPGSDTYVFGRDQTPRAEYVLDASLDGNVQAASLADGDGVHATILERTGGGTFARVAGPEDGIGMSGDFGGAFVGDTLAVVSQKRDLRGEVVGIPPGGTFATGTVLVPASAAVVKSVVPVAGGFATSDIDGGDGSARLFGPDGSARGGVPVPPISTLTELAGDPAGGPLVSARSAIRRRTGGSRSTRTRNASRRRESR